MADRVSVSAAAEAVGCAVGSVRREAAGACMTFQPNGCGPRSWRRRIPTWHATELCNAHDVAYHTGGTEADRKRADYALYDGMRRQAAKEAWPRRVWMLAQAWVFYRAVRATGAKHFHYVRG